MNAQNQISQTLKNARMEITIAHIDIEKLKTENIDLKSHWEQVEKILKSKESLAEKN